jgi:hypothetical protein
MKRISIQREIMRLEQHLWHFWLKYDGHIPYKEAIRATEIIKSRINELQQKLKV